MKKKYIVPGEKIAYLESEPLLQAVSQTENNNSAHDNNNPGGSAPGIGEDNEEPAVKGSILYDDEW